MATSHGELQKLGLTIAQWPSISRDFAALKSRRRRRGGPSSRTFANGERLSQAIAEALPVPAADGKRIVGDLPGELRRDTQGAKTETTVA